MTTAIAERDTAKHGRRLTIEQQQHALALSKDGVSAVRISEQIGCHRSAIDYTLKKFADTRQTAQNYLHAKALDAIEHWEHAAQIAAKKGNHIPAKEFAEAALPELRPAVGNGNSAQVVVLLGTSGQPLSPPALVGESRVVSVVSADSAHLVLPAHASNSADHGET